MIKQNIKRKFPTMYEYYLLTKQKWNERPLIKYYTSLSENNYALELEKLYKERTGNNLDLENPKRFSEKIQWRKLRDITPLISGLSDKYLVRDWVKEKIGEQYLIPLLGVWDSFDEIDFSKLPHSFVLKVNNASGENLVVTDKSKLNFKLAKSKVDYWMKRPFGLLSGLELQYCNIEPKIIAEEYIGDSPVDYKFFCFNSKVYCLYTTVDFGGNEETGKLGFFDRDFRLMDVTRADYLKPLNRQLDRPENFELMIKIAETLSSDFSHVRVDLYNISGKVYFGEMTFTTHSGYMKFDPDEFDYLLGSQWKIS